MEKTYTIANLRLDVGEAERGRPWLLLPDGFRDRASGRTYPLPSNAGELQRLMAIPINARQKDAGTIYLLRAEKKWQEGRRRRVSALVDTEAKKQDISNARAALRTEMRQLKHEAERAVNEVRIEAEKQIANLSDLFALGRKGIEGQMRAHLDGAEWKGESISARDFRDCFRMVSQAVKGLGLPSDQREKAREVVMQEVAEAAESTKDALSLAPGGKDPEVEH
jgi:hypothetical protein